MSNSSTFKDFYQVPNVTFDISKLRSDLDTVLKKSKYQTLGITNFHAIPMNKIPGDENSILGGNVRGIYWTMPDTTNYEEQRLEPINESLYTELCPEFKDTYVEEVYNLVKKHFKIGRMRFLMKPPRTCLSWHRDPEKRLHIPIITNEGCKMVIEDISFHMPADGSAYITDNTKYHNFFNGSEIERVHLVSTLIW